MKKTGVECNLYLSYNFDDDAHVFINSLHDYFFYILNFNEGN